MPLYSVVIPCYRSAKTISSVVEDTEKEFSRIGIDQYEFVLVNDGSPDEGATIHVLEGLAEEKPYVKVIDLGKNSGQHNATMAGLNYASGDFIISMDDDGQTKPSQIRPLLDKLDEGYDLVYGYYPEKKESLFRRFGSTINYLTVRLLVHKPKWMKTSSFWAMRKYVRDYAIQYRNPSVHLQGVFLRITSNIACVPIQHFERKEGKSGYTVKKLFDLYINIFTFSLVPIRALDILGLVLLFGGLIALIVLLIGRSLGSGWASPFRLLASGMFSLAGIIILAIGIVGEYIVWSHRGQTNAPQFVVRNTKNLSDNQQNGDCNS